MRDLDLTNCKVKQFDVKLITIQEATHIIKDWHYSGSTNGLMVSQCFGLFYEGTLIGTIIYGGLAMANAWKKYAEQPSDVVELRRLACIDATPKNTESYFIGKTIRWLKRNTEYKLIVSYADPFHGHQGIIYRASNFEHKGMTSKGRMIQDQDGRLFHDKAIRTTYTNKKGVKSLKPFAARLKKRLESGDAKYINTPGKHIYTYQL
jgi:hypothetical protein